MRALVKTKPGPGLSMEDVPVPEIGPDDVLVRVRKTGVCGTDVHIWNWDEWAAKTVPVPLVIGHEFAGEIVELGRNVTDLHLGQRFPAKVTSSAAHRGSRVPASSISTPKRGGSGSMNRAPSPNT